MLVFAIHAGIYDSCWYLHFMLVFTLHEFELTRIIMVSEQAAPGGEGGADQ